MSGCFLSGLISPGIPVPGSSHAILSERIQWLVTALVYYYNTVVSNSNWEVEQKVGNSNAIPPCFGFSFSWILGVACDQVEGETNIKKIYYIYLFVLEYYLDLMKSGIDWFRCITCLKWRWSKEPVNKKKWLMLNGIPVFSSLTVIIHGYRYAHGIIVKKYRIETTNHTFIISKI